MVKTAMLKGQVALLSGGTSGIGLGIAHEMGRQGARVAVFGRDAEKAEAAAAELVSNAIDAIGVAADVRDYAAVAAAVQAVTARYGRLDIVVAAAAGNFVSPAAALSAGGFKAVVDIDLLGTFNLFRAACEAVTDGAMIAITAPQARMTMPGQAHVSAAKAGVDALVRALAREWGPRGIRVNAISPGPIAGTEGVERMTAADHDMAASWQNEIPLRRFGLVSDIAALAAFLASPQAGYITGTIIDCDGGWQLGNAGHGWLSATPR